MKRGAVTLGTLALAAVSAASAATQPVQVDERYVIRTDPHHIPMDQNPLVERRHELRGLPEEREQINRWIAECDNGGQGDSGVFDICNQLIQTQWFAGDAEGHLRVRRAQAWLDMGDEARALRELDYGLQLYTHAEGPGVPIPEAPDNLPRHPGTETIQPRAQGFCERATIRWRSGDLDGARVDFETARSHWPDEPCAAEGLAGLARGGSAPTLVAGARTQQRLRQTVTQSCAAERMTAARAWFGGQADETHAARLDAALEPLGVFSADLDTLARNRAMFTESLSGDPRAQASEAYLVCLQTARIRQIQPGFDFSRQVELDGPAIEAAELDDGGAVEAAPEDDIFADLPRRDAGAAAGLLSESLDPQARRQRQMRVAEDTRRRQANMQRRAENRAAFWSALGDVLLVGAQTYIAVESARLEMEAQQALDLQRAAQAAALPPAMHSASPTPSGSMTANQTGPRGHPYAPSPAAIPYGSTPGCISFRMHQNLLGRYYDVVSSCSTTMHFVIGPPELMNPSESENRYYAAGDVFQPGRQRTLSDNYFFVRSRYSAPQVLFACMDRNAAEQALGVTLQSIHFDYGQRTCVAVPSPPPQRVGTAN